MTDIYLIELNDENRLEMLKVALSMYIGEECQYCHCQFLTLDDLKVAVWSPWAKGRIAHKSCFMKAHPDYKS